MKFPACTSRLLRTKEENKKGLVSDDDEASVRSNSLRVLPLPNSATGWQWNIKHTTFERHSRPKLQNQARPGPPLGKPSLWGWRGGSLVMSTHCPCRGTKFCSQHHIRQRTSHASIYMQYRWCCSFLNPMVQKLHCSHLPIFTVQPGHCSLIHIL